MLAIDRKAIDKLVEDSRSSPRKRLALSMHSPEHGGPRMLAVCLQPDSYMVPHLHQSKFGEILMHVQGKIALFLFYNDGRVKEIVFLSDEQTRAIEIPPSTYHTTMALSKDSVLFEISQGPYLADSYKSFATWAPKEDSEEAQSYWKALHSSIK